jgi:hypothetical protein
MLDYVYGHDAVVADFVAQLIPRCRERGFPSTAKAIGIIKNDSLVAGLVYSNYDPDAGIIEMSGAALPGINWLTRGVIDRMYQYPFLQCGCQMIVQQTAASDERLLGMLAAYDYAFIPVPRLFGRDKDGVLCCLTYEAWANNRCNRHSRRRLSDSSLPIEEAA